MVLMRRAQLFIAIVGFLLFGILFAAMTEAHSDEQVVCLDPGHQLHGNNGLEPVGPGGKEMKAKVSSGTRGVKTKKPEYVLNLEVALFIKDKLEPLGYKVVMTRDTHEVDISNKERAVLCNEAGADLAVRIHADGDPSPKAKGISLLYPARSEYSEMLVSTSKEAAQIVLQEALQATGAASRDVVARSDLAGFNWSEVPSILIEMGFMTNSEEDEKLSDADYLDRLAQGVVNGINRYLAVQAEDTETEGDSAIYLPQKTQLYELTDGKLIRTSSSVIPQSVQISARRGAWAKVDTWLGQRWIRIGSNAD